jgi:hypothetical protein
VIVFEFLTGTTPFIDDTPELVFAKILKKEMTYPPVGNEED